MGKIPRLYFAFALLLIFSFCMQVAKCNPVVPFDSVSQEESLPSLSSIELTALSFAWESEKQNAAVLSLVTAVSYRTLNEKNGKFLLSSPIRLPYFRSLPSFRQETIHLHILSGRHSDGFYLYFLKKLLI